MAGVTETTDLSYQMFVVRTDQMGIHFGLKPMVDCIGTLQRKSLL
jgi:hypothetical protein